MTEEYEFTEAELKQCLYTITQEITHVLDEGDYHDILSMIATLEHAVFVSRLKICETMGHPLDG